MRPFSHLLFLFLIFSAAIFATQIQASQTLTPLRSTEGGLLFTIKGSNTIGGRLAPHWAKHFLEKKGLTSVSILPTSQENEYKVAGYNDTVSAYINVYAHGSNTGFEGLKNRDAHIAMSSRPIKVEENQAISSTIDLRRFEAEHVVAIDGLAIIVHKNNPINTLSKQQIAKIFSGEITSWASVGWLDIPIEVYARDDKSGTWDTFKSIVLNKTRPLTKKSVRFESNDDLSLQVSNNPYAIGFVGLASVLSSKALAISDHGTAPIRPDPIFVATEDYPLSRRLFMYSVPNGLNSYARDFLDFIQTDSGQKVVNEIGFISQKPITIDIDTDDLNGPYDYLKLVENAKRLSVNFRFREGSSSLDNKAKQDILRIVNYMKKPEHKDKIVQLIGFGDSKRTNERSTLLSKLRAMSVKTALHKSGVNVTSVTGFGDHMPIASQAGDLKHKNQRVEVWVFDAKHKKTIDKIKKDASIRKRQESTTKLVHR